MSAEFKIQMDHASMIAPYMTNKMHPIKLISRIQSCLEKRNDVRMNAPANKPIISMLSMFSSSTACSACKEYHIDRRLC